MRLRSWQCAFVAMATLLACGSSKKGSSGSSNPNDDNSVVTPPGSQDGGGGNGDGGGPIIIQPTPDASTGNDGSAPPTGDPLGPTPVVDVADIAGVDTGGSASEATPADPNGPLYDRLGAVGTKRFAVSSDFLALITFGTGGEHSAVIANVIAGAGEGDLVAALLKPGNDLSLQRYDAAGAASGSAIAITTANDWQAIAVGSAKTFVVWSSAGAMAGKLFDRGTATSTDVDLGADTAGAGTYAIHTVASSTGFIVAWTRNRADLKTETMWRRVNADGTSSAPQSLVLSSGDHLVAGLAALPNGEAAALINEGSPSHVSSVLRIDTNGAPVLPAWRLQGSERGFGIAAHGGELGIVAIKENRSAFRALALDGTALGPWYWLDDNVDSGAGFYPQAAVDDDSTGYAHIARATNGAAILRHVDHLGAGL